MLYGICLALGLLCADADTPPVTASVITVSAPSAMSVSIETPAPQKPAMAKPTWFPPDCEVQPPVEYQHLFVEAARRYPGVSACELAKQSWCESNFNTFALSPAGAKGLAQFLDATAKELGVTDSYNPKQAIPAMARYVDWTRGGWSEVGRVYSFDIVGLGACTYNFGRGACFRNQKKHGWYLLVDALPHLPTETQGYIPCVIKGTRT